MFNQINAALVSTRDFFQKHQTIYSPQTFENYNKITIWLTREMKNIMTISFFWWTVPLTGNMVNQLNSVCVIGQDLLKT